LLARNCVACSRRGLAYFVEYLRMYWTDFHNLFTYESALRANNGSVPYFPICQGSLPWQPNNFAVMKANCTTCILWTFDRCSTVLFCYYLLWGDTVVPSGLLARLCHAFLVFFIHEYCNHLWPPFSGVGIDTKSHQHVTTTSRMTRANCVSRK